jgi:hypothetical protein
VQQATCKVKMAKCSWNVIKSNNSRNVLGWKGKVVESVPKCKRRLVIKVMLVGGKQLRCNEHLWKLVTIVYESLNYKGV